MQMKSINFHVEGREKLLIISIHLEQFVKLTHKKNNPFGLKFICFNFFSHFDERKLNLREESFGIIISLIAGNLFRLRFVFSVSSTWDCLADSKLFRCT